MWTFVMYDNQKLFGILSTSNKERRAEVDTLIDKHKDKCPFMGKAGCKLPIKDRPLDCIDYLCVLAKRTIQYELSKEQALSLLAKRPKGEWGWFKRPIH